MSCRCDGTAVSKPLKNPTDMCRRLFLEDQEKEKKFEVEGLIGGLERVGRARDYHQSFLP